MSPASRPRRRGRWFFLGLLLAFGIAQAMPVQRTNPPVTWDVDAPAEVAAILRGACYDCHSHETRWPWYSRVAPVAWVVARHVEKGRGDLDFSDWPRLDLEAQEHAFHDIEKQISRRKMPLRSYTWMHPQARLTEAQRQTLLAWAKGMGSLSSGANGTE